MSGSSNTVRRYSTHDQSTFDRTPPSIARPATFVVDDTFTSNNGMRVRAREISPTKEAPVVPAPPGAKAPNGGPLVSVTEQLKRVDVLLDKFKSQSRAQEAKNINAIQDAKRMLAGHMKSREATRKVRADKLLGNAAQAHVFFDEALDRETQLTRFRNALETLDGMVELQQIVETCQQYKVDPNLLPNLESAVESMNSLSANSAEPFAGLSAAQRAKASEYKESMAKELNFSNV